MFRRGYMRVLIIEDNVEILKCMKVELEKSGLYVDIANNGLEGEQKAYVNEYDVILLDLSLPDKDGMEILKYLRKENIETPIIIITASIEITKGLNLGADDYIVKPFNMDELNARIQAVLRRFRGRGNPNIVLNQLIIDPISRRANYDKKRIDLTTKEFDILEYLAIRYPAIVSSEEILEHTYDESFDSFSSVLRVHIAKLRKKLKKTTGKDILLTTRGKGYSLFFE
jgi:cell cycle transcriptional regulator ctrA